MRFCQNTRVKSTEELDSVPPGRFFEFSYLRKKRGSKLDSRLDGLDLKKPLQKLIYMWKKKNCKGIVFSRSPWRMLIARLAPDFLWFTDKRYRASLQFQGFLSWRKWSTGTTIVSLKNDDKTKFRQQVENNTREINSGKYAYVWWELLSIFRNIFDGEWWRILEEFEEGCNARGWSRSCIVLYLLKTESYRRQGVEGREVDEEGPVRYSSHLPSIYFQS